jgi:sugar/nucleoside kinase (ribokinase family)
MYNCSTGNLHPCRLGSAISDNHFFLLFLSALAANQISTQTRQQQGLNLKFAMLTISPDQHSLPTK